MGNQTVLHLSEISTLWREVSRNNHVRTLAVQEAVSESKASAADCGPNLLGSFAKYDPVTHSLKTRQTLLFEDLTESLVTLPGSGIMQDGECFQLALLVRHTHEKGCSFLPTVCAGDYKHGATQERTNRMREQSKRGLDLPSHLRFIGWNVALHPHSAEALMVWPIGWTELKPLEMDKFRLWLRLHGELFQDSNTK